MSVETLLDQDACAQAAAVRSGAVSARELVAGAIARIEALNPRLNVLLNATSLFAAILLVAFVGGNYFYRRALERRGAGAHVIVRKDGRV